MTNETVKYLITLKIEQGNRILLREDHQQTIVVPVGPFALAFD